MRFHQSPSAHREDPYDAEVWYQAPSPKGEGGYYYALRMAGQRLPFGPPTGPFATKQRAIAYCQARFVGLDSVDSDLDPTDS